MVKVNAPEKEDRPIIRNGWRLVHDVPLSTRMKDYFIQKKIEDFKDDETEEYV